MQVCSVRITPVSAPPDQNQKLDDFRLIAGILNRCAGPDLIVEGYVRVQRAHIIVRPPKHAPGLVSYLDLGLR
jgi:hypothetical protein